MPDYFVNMLVAIAAVMAISMVGFYIMWKVVDRITPGNLGEQIAPSNAGLGLPQSPNKCLTTIICTMLACFSLVLSATILGVFFH